MALPRCPKCENQNFEMAVVEPGNWRFKVMFIVQTVKQLLGQWIILTSAL